MRLRPVWLLPWVLCLGCHSLVGVDLDGDGPEAERLWDKGQTAMKEGDAGQAIGFAKRNAGKPFDLAPIQLIEFSHADAENTGAAAHPKVAKIVFENFVNFVTK